MKNKYVDLEALNHGLKELATKINSVFRKIKDSYTKTEIDDKFTSMAKGMNWKPSVATKVDLEALTDNNKSDTRIVEDESKIYMYNGTSWEGIGSSANVPKATIDNDGLMSKEDFTKLEGIEPDKYETKEDFNTKVGSLTSLNTDNKDSVVSAINEVKEGVNNTVKIDDTVVDTNKAYSSKKINDTYVKKEENKSLVPDSEIEKIHTHTNKDYLDKISENTEGKPLYNGNIIGDDLKPATKDTLGGIKVGDNLEITNEGILSATKVSEISDTKLADDSTYSSNKINNTYVAKEEGKSLVEDTEISKIHEHNNKAYLDKLGENESGKPTYDGKEIGTGGSGANIDDTNISTDTTYSSEKIEGKFVGEIEGYTDDELKAMLGLSEDDKDLIKNLITDDSVIDTTKTWNSSVLNKKFNNIHTHSNKDDLDKLGHDEKGNLTYNEVIVGGSSITVDTELNDTSENPVQNKVIKAKLDEVFQSVSNGKTLLETAITDMGGTVSKTGDIATYNEIKKGLSTLSLTQANLFVQENEPETKYGLWLKTSNSYDDIIDIKSSGDTITYTKMTDIPYNFISGSSISIGTDIYLIGGSAYKKYNYKYDTLTDTYTKMADIPYEFYNGSATSIGTDIYLVGSDLYNTSYAKNNYKYDTLTDTYIKMTDIPYNFSYGSSISIGTDIYLIGGSAYKKYNYKYDTLTDTYTKMADIPYNFSSGSAVAIGSDIYLLGWTSDGKYNYKYDTTTDTYTKMADIPYDFYKSSAVAIGSDIYLLGSGYNTDSVYPYTKYNYKYNILSDTYIKMTDLPYGFYKGNIATVNNKIYMLGGEVSLNYNYRIDFTILDKNSIVFLNSSMPFKHKTKMFNTPYGVLNYINFDSVIMTDENGNNANVEVYIGNGASWNKI